MTVVKLLRPCLLAGSGLLISSGLSISAQAQVSVQGGGNSCLPVISSITRDWISVKQVMAPLKAKIRRPKTEDFFCVSPYHTRDAMPRNVTAGSELRCYSDPGNEGLGMCCDANLTACAQLRPDVIPENARRPAKKKKYERPKSSWVKVPTDSDQWKSPPE